MILIFKLYNVDKFLQDKKCKENICKDLDELDKKDKFVISPKKLVTN